VERAAQLSKICVDFCGGKCCEPWWGIILYTITKSGGLSRLNDFKREVHRGIESRVERIRTRYVTSEKPPRLLFGEPERYNVTVEKCAVAGDTLRIELRAMFAFKCLFLSTDGRCQIHPSLLGSDIRPPHCARLGSPEAEAMGEGYCRIIDRAVRSSMDEGEVASAIEMESAVSRKHYDEGCAASGEAAERVIASIRRYCEEHAPHLLPVTEAKKPGRNDPCHCGSGLKFKKCHGQS